jgi:hypothetical protein
MQITLTSKIFPAYLWGLLAIYFVASLAHFISNAEYIAYYPNMPAWVTRETVYLVWLAITAVGISGLVASRIGARLLGAILIAAYGALGLDGLAHYLVALCGEYTLVMNLTIWSEALSGLLLALSFVVFAKRLLRVDAKNFIV